MSRLERLADKKREQLRGSDLIIPEYSGWESLLFPALSVSIIAFDQSLGHCGWVLLTPPHEVMYPVVVDYGCFDHEVGNTESKMLVSIELCDQIGELLRTYSPGGVVCEQPWMGGNLGGRARGAESMLLAAQALWLACHLSKVSEPKMVKAQWMKRDLTGNQSASKKQVREAIREIYPDALPGANEHVYDAVGLGLSATRKWFSERGITS